jgi:hypothetical protein
MGSFDINFIETLVAAGILRERAQSLTEVLIYRSNGRHSRSARHADHKVVTGVVTGQ